MVAHPHTSSAVHHHGEQDTIVYAASGHGAVISDHGKTRQELSPGDFALIPAWTEHQEVNEGDEEVTWIITRSGPVSMRFRLSRAGPLARQEHLQTLSHRDEPYSSQY